VPGPHALGANSLTDIGRVGVMACYDLRFPEVAQLMALAGVSNTDSVSPGAMSADSR
jgi:hypothetical protein